MSSLALHSLARNVLDRLPVRVAGFLRETRREMKARALERTVARKFPEVRDLWKEIRRRSLTYCTDAHLLSLARLCRDIETHRREGAFIEAGCARGGSTVLLCALKSRTRPFRVYDVFGEIPPPTDADGDDLKARYVEISRGKAVGLGGQVHYSYEPDLMAQVIRTFEELGYPAEQHQVTFTPGPVERTLTVDGPVALAHVDVDFFAPVAACLERVVPQLVVGGALVVRAYQDWSSSRKATDAYFSAHGDAGFTFDTSAGHMVIRRVR